MDTLYVLFLFAYVPSLAILWYFYSKDRLEPEPKRYVAMTFVYGAVVSIGIAIFLEKILQEIFQDIIPPVLAISLFSAIVEEPSKALAIRFPYDAGQMDGVMDGVVYGVAAGLGFAATENFLYGIGFGVEVTLFRVLLIPIGHGAWTSITGVGYGLKSEGKVSSVVPFLLIAIVFHFSWNYLVIISSEFYPYMLFLVIVFLLNIGILRYFVSLGYKEDVEKFGG
jgi:RsiW-degrading membrane proteinase PrsW (M82 family)